MEKIKTPEKILEEYLVAVKKGDTEAMTNIGLILEEEGNKKDAEKWYLKAIENGNFKSAGNLAFLYEMQGKKKEAEEIQIGRAHV